MRFHTPSGRKINTIRNWDYEELKIRVLADMPPIRNNEKVVFTPEEDLFKGFHDQECSRLMNLPKKGNKNGN
jgi:hypothetical protein